MMKVIRLLKNCNHGATAIEYALIAALISVVIVVALQNVSEKVQGNFSTVTSALEPQ